MNFYSNKLKAKKYRKIIENYKKKFSKDYILRNWGIFSGDKSFYRTLKLFQILSGIKIRKVKGDIVEFGIWHGNNLFTIKKIMDFLELKKNLYGYDHFEGLKNPNKKDKYFLKSDLGTYIGDKKLIKYVIKFFKFKKVKIIDNDIMNLERKIKDFKKLSFIYIDCDLYEPTLKILKLLTPRLSKGGVIAFDEGNKKKWIGEGKALEDFLLNNKKRFKKTYLKKNYQPDVILTKLV